MIDKVIGFLVPLFLMLLLIGVVFNLVVNWGVIILFVIVIFVLSRLL
jgi:hypothetical protein